MYGCFEGSDLLVLGRGRAIGLSTSPGTGAVKGMSATLSGGTHIITKAQKPRNRNVLFLRLASLFRHCLQLVMIHTVDARSLLYRDGLLLCPVRHGACAPETSQS